MSYIPCPPLTPPLSSLSPRARLSPLTPTVLSSIPWDCKHTAASAGIDVHLGMLSLLLTPPKPPSSLLSPQAQFPLPTPPSLSSILHASHRNTTSFFIVPESLPPPLLSLIPWTRCLFIFLHRRLRNRHLFQRPDSVTPPTWS